MTWQNGLQWATSLGQYGILAEFAVMGALMLAGIISHQLFGDKSVRGEVDDSGD